MTWSSRNLGGGPLQRYYDEMNISTRVAKKCFTPYNSRRGTNAYSGSCLAGGSAGISPLFHPARTSLPAVLNRGSKLHSRLHFRSICRNGNLSYGRFRAVDSSILSDRVGDFRIVEKRSRRLILKPASSGPSKISRISKCQNNFRLKGALLIKNSSTFTPRLQSGIAILTRSSIDKKRPYNRQGVLTKNDEHQETKGNGQFKLPLASVRKL